MPVQTLPGSARRYAVAQRVEVAAAVAAASRAWRGMGVEFEASWSLVGPRLVAVVETAQARVAAGAVEYIPAVLEETGQSQAVEPFATPRPDGLVGVAGDGRPVGSLMYGAVVHAREGVAGGLTAPAALRNAGQWLTLAVGTALSDTGRQSESLAMGVRPVGGYVRMLNPPSCSRCVILAGRWYRKNAGFQRHPGCDCRHIPAAESIGGDLAVDPQAYFDSLTPAEQDRTFTKAGAEAVREGANVGRVVNARRGVSKAQAGRRKAGARLMPETIQQIATDRADYLRLLGANGYLG